MPGSVYQRKSSHGKDGRSHGQYDGPKRRETDLLDEGSWARSSPRERTLGKAAASEHGSTAPAPTRITYYDELACGARLLQSGCSSPRRRPDGLLSPNESIWLETRHLRLITKER